MTQTETAERAERSLRLLDEAERHLEDDDLYKACEKGLEAVNGYLRAVGEERGWAAETQRDLNAIVTDLAMETDDWKEALRMHGAADGGFAIEFWGSHHTWWSVEVGISAARKWIALMEGRSKPPSEVRESQLERDAQGRRELLEELRASRNGRPLLLDRFRERLNDQA